MGGEFTLDWGALVPLIVHPTKVKIIEAMRWINRPLSASELECIFDTTLSLSVVSYHLTTLQKWEVVEERGSRRVRGSTEHFYFFNDAIRKEPLAKRS
jgi:DNA-binding transcriptional ArsR family regulator